MKLLVWSCCLLSLALPLAWIVAAEPASKTVDEICQTELTEEKLANPPDRKTIYEIVPEAVKVKLTDVKLVDQKYAAMLRIELPRSSGGPGSFSGTTPRLRDDKKLFALQYVDGTSLLGQGYSPGITREPWLPQVLAQIPEDRLPAKEIRELFASTAFVPRVLNLPGDLDSTAEGNWERRLRLLASTPAEAELRSRALLSAIDQGYSRPIQLYLWRQRTAHCDELRAVDGRIPMQKMEVSTLSDKLREFQEFPPELLADLRVQLLQMEVDLAGIKARLVLWEKLLAANAGKEDRLQQITAAKEAAEVELAGIEARRAKSAEFVGKVKERIALQDQLGKAQAASASSQRKRLTLQKEIEQLDQELAGFSPLQLVDNRVTIHRVDWTQ